MYESPISLKRQIDAIHQEINKTVEGEIVSEVREKLHVEINVRELKKALAYDRGQYEKGFDDGFAKAEEKNKKAEGHWITRFDGSLHYCSECGWALMDTESGVSPYMGTDYHRSNEERWTCCPGWNEWLMNFCPECGARMTGREAES